jgi:hypothetical protein
MQDLGKLRLAVSNDSLVEVMSALQSLGINKPTINQCMVWSVEKNSTKVLKYLLTLPPHIKPSYENPIEVSLRKRNNDCLKLLIKNIEPNKEKKYRALLKAVEFENYDANKIILKSFSSSDIRDILSKAENSSEKSKTHLVTILLLKQEIGRREMASKRSVELSAKEMI